MDSPSLSFIIPNAHSPSLHVIQSEANRAYRWGEIRDVESQIGRKGLILFSKSNRMKPTAAVDRRLIP